MGKLVHRIITHQSFAPGIKGGEYYYCDGIDREINQVMQEPLEKLYKYENQPDMRGKVKEYISELDVEIDRCVDEAESILAAIGDYDEKPMPTNYIRLEETAKVLGEVKNDLQSRLEELI